MSDLSPEARALLDASRKALRPTTADRDRIEAALHLKLSGRPTSGSQSTGATSSWKVILGATIGVCLIGVVTHLAFRSEPARTPVLSARSAQPDRTPSAVAAPQPSAATPAVEPALMPPESHDVSSPAKAARRVRAPRSDQLALEVELLSRATSALRAGHAAAALKTLEEHEHKFPNGTLRQERAVAKVQALCGLGRVHEGLAEVEHLLPDAPATVRARQSCER